MPSAVRRKAREQLRLAREGVVYYGHQRIYEVIDKLRDSAARLDGAKRRELLFKCDEIRKALDAKVEEFAAGVRDPSVEDHAAIFEGVYNLLRDCQPIYHALKSKGSFAEACDEFDAAQATLIRFADEDEAYGEYRKLHGGWVRQNGKWVKLNAKDFAKWQAANKQSERNFAENPYKHTAQTTEEHVDAFKSKQKATKRKKNRYKKRRERYTKKARVDEEPTPPGLEMHVTGGNKVKYCVHSHIFKHAPEGYSNGYTTKEQALELAALCLANRPAGTTLAEQQAARAQEGRAKGVHHEGDGYMARVSPKKNTQVILTAPGGGYVFDTAAAAAEAIKDYKDAGSPTNKSDPLVYSIWRKK